MRTYLSTTFGRRTGFGGNERRLIEFMLSFFNDQHRIVAYLDDLQAKVDAVKRLQAETQAELATLLLSVLDRAFRGGI